jgi:plasmid stabilization system protein ParE
MQIAWSGEARFDYQQNIDYLLREWTEQVASDFIEDVETVIGLIKIYPEMYPLTDFLGARKAVVNKQITLFYRIKGDTIYLLRFWNNYQDPKKLKL